MSRPTNRQPKKRPRREGAEPQAPPEDERLQKVLAAAGVASRRQCELLILEGRVDIDRQIVTQLGVRVDPSKQSIRVDGQPITPSKPLYYIVNKPKGVVTTNRDPQGRPRVVDLINTEQRLFCVGRLDMSSEGLLLVTNDGELANRLAHPRYGVEKIYQVEVAGRPTLADLAPILKGIRLAEGVTRVDRLRIQRSSKQSTRIEMTLREGRNREIRRVFARLGHKVLRLKRIAMGGIKLGDLPSGAYRPLTRQEIVALRRAIGSGVIKRKRPKKAGANPAKPSAISARRSRTILGGDARKLAPKKKHSASNKAVKKKAPRKGR